MKFLDIVLISTVLLTSLTSCNSPQREVRAVTNKYVRADFDMELEILYSLISSEDREAKSLEELKKDLTPVVLSLRKILNDKSEFKIIQINENGDRATSIVEKKIPDVVKIYQEFLGTAFSGNLRKDSKDIEEGKIASQLMAEYENKEIPMKEEIDTLSLIKENDGWKVRVGWKLQKLLTGAIAAESDNDYQKAALMYEQVIEMDSTNAKAIKGLDSVRAEIKKQEEKAEYIDKIEIYDLKARYYSTYSGNIPGVDFKLKNNGNRTLTEVEVTIYFMDDSGTIIYEEDYHPVLVTDYSFGDSKPLKPNYVWRMERGKFYSAKSVPNEWKAGFAKAKVTDIEFGDTD